MNKMTLAKIIKLLTITVFLTVLLLPCLTAQAAWGDSEKETIEFSPNVSIPGSEFKTGEPVAVEQTGQPNLLVRYIQAIYKFFVGIAGIVAVFMIVFGGVIWLFSGGNATKIGQAKEIILGAIFGLLLALGSYMILNTLNPSLVNFQLQVAEVPGLTLPAYWCDDVEVAFDFQDPYFTDVINGGYVLQEGTLCSRQYYLPIKSLNEKKKYTCHGREGCDIGETCGLYFTSKGMENKCMAPQTACQSIGDSKAEDYGMEEGQNACNTLKIKPEQGVCLWLNHAVAASDTGGDYCKFFDRSWLDSVCPNVEQCDDYIFLSERQPEQRAFCTNNVCAIVTNKNLNCKFIEPGYVGQWITDVLGYPINLVANIWNIGFTTALDVTPPISSDNTNGNCVPK
ncbi:pilin [Patescibacteria group bacterium]|nr:pilin [Patescibacteria group bacterium]